MLNATTAADTMDTPTSACAGVAGVCASPYPENRATGLQSAPADLLHFLRAAAVVDVARELGLTRGTVYRLRDGYWPAEPRKILQAWARHLAQRGVVHSWFLRRVRADGLVRHAGLDFTAPSLPARVGQMLALARAADGSLIAQTLELPAERFVLTQSAL